MKVRWRSGRKEKGVRRCWAVVSGPVLWGLRDWAEWKKEGMV